MRKSFIILIKAFISILFLSVLFLLVRKESFLAMLHEVDVAYVILSFLLTVVMVVVSCFKWHILLKAQGHNPGFGYLLKTYLVGYYFTNFLPSNVGGDVVRSYYVGKAIGSQGDAAVSVFLERFTGMICLLLLAIFAPALQPELYTHPGIWIPALGAVGLLATVLWVGFAKRPLGFVDRVMGRLLKSEGVLRRTYLKGRSKAQSFHDKLQQALRRLRDRSMILWTVIFITAGFYVLTWVNVYLAYKVFGVTPSLTGIVALTATVLLVSMVPISLASLGLLEGAFVFYFGLIGVPGEASLAMGLFLRCKLLVLGCLGFLFYMTYKDRRHERIERPTENGATGPAGTP